MRNVDAEARRARESWELAVVRNDAPATLEASKEMLRIVEVDPDYVILGLIPVQRAAPQAEGPRAIMAQFDGACRQCRAPVKAGADCWFTPGVKGVLCSKCGGGR